jgi:hypothetical protein
MTIERVIAHLAAGENFGYSMADQLADPFKSVTRGARVG